jgi:hypothetical protein
MRQPRKAKHTVNLWQQRNDHLEHKNKKRELVRKLSVPEAII